MNSKPLLALTVAAALSAVSSVGQAASPHEIVSVEASNPVLHGLEVKTPLDAKRRFVTIRGPQFVSAPETEPDEGLPSILTWYAVRKPDDEAVRKVQLADEFSGGKTFTVMLGKPAYYLMPAQAITDGPPQEIPESLNLFLAFEVVNVDSVALPEPTPGKPAFVCLPAEQWHHEEYVPLKSPAEWLMVYEVPAQSLDGKWTTIDQFGLNGLKKGDKRFVYVPARQK